MKVMNPINLEMGVIFLIQTGAGILGNSSLLCFYNFTLLTGRKVRATDVILNQLVFANNSAVVSRGIPHTLAAFGWENFLDDAGCKVVFYFHRVAKGVSLNTICLLSGFQVTTLCPTSSWWKKFRTRCPKYICFCGFFLWILQLLVNVYIPMGVRGPRSSPNISRNYRYCSVLVPNISIILLNAVVYCSMDLMCLGFMVWASSTMLLVLHRHKQRVRHMRSSSLSPRPSHEDRATRTILILATTFVFFHCISSLVTLCVALFGDQWLIDTAAFLAMCFSVLSPFVLISSDTRAIHIFRVCTTRNCYS